MGVWRALLTLAKQTGAGGHGVPLQSLLEQCQMLFQPPDLLPFDSGYISVPVHVPEKYNNRDFSVEYTRD